MKRIVPSCIISKLALPCTFPQQIPPLETSLSQLDRRVPFSDELEVLGKTLQVLAEHNDILYIEGGLRLFRIDKVRKGKTETGILPFRGYKFIATFQLLDVKIVPEEQVTFPSLKRGWL